MSKEISTSKRGVGRPMFGKWFPFALMDEFFNDQVQPLMRSGFEAHLDLAENQNGYEVKVDLPGVSPDEVDIRIDGNTLTITGERVSEKESDEKSEYHRVERVSGKFSRSIVLPGEVDEEKASAEFQSGVLKITIPRSEGSKARRITIK